MNPDIDPILFAAKTAHVAALLKAMGNPKRLTILCRLVEHGEMRVGDLAETVALSQSALSQHLAVLRKDGLVAFRRESQAIWYRIADTRLEALLTVLYNLYCR